MQDVRKLSKALQDTVVEVRPNTWPNGNSSVTGFAANKFCIVCACVGHSAPRGLERPTPRARAQP